MLSQLAKEKAAQAWCKPTTSHKAMDVELGEAFAEILEEVWSQPWLGNATTGQLLDEVKARSNLSYRTVGGEYIPDPATMTNAPDKLTWESMTALTVGRFSVRVWREEEDGILNTVSWMNDDLKRFALELAEWDNTVVIAKAFCKLDRVAAVEVLEPDRCGLVVYRNWPD